MAYSLGLKSGFPKTTFIIPFSFLLLNIYLLFATKLDIWDSVIFQYAESTGLWGGWINFLDESGWEIYIPAYYLMKFLGGVFSAGYFFGFKIIMAAIYCWLFLEIALFMNRLGMKENQIAVALTLIFSSQIMSASFGTPMTMHFLTIPIAFAAVRLYQSQGLRRKILSIPLMLFSFTVNTWILLIPIWIIGEYFFTRNKIDKPRRSFYLGLPVAAGFGYYLVQNALNPKQGYYLNYNDPSLLFSSQGALAALASLFWFGLLASPLALIAILLAQRVFSQRLASARSTIKIFSFETRLVALLLIVSALPYVVVGKAPVFFESWDWSGRNGFIFMLFAGVLFSIFFDKLTPTFIPKVSRHFSWSISATSLLIVVILSQNFLLLLGFQVRDQRMQLENQLVAMIRELPEEIPAGKVQIIGSGFPLNGFSDYESNWMLFRATGESKWLSQIVAKPKEFENNIDWIKNPNYAARGLFSGGELICETRMFITASGYTTRNNLIETVPNLISSDKSVRLTKTESVCNE